MTNKPEQRRRNERPVRRENQIIQKTYCSEGSDICEGHHGCFRMKAIKLEYGNDFALPNVSPHVKEMRYTS